MSAIRHDAAGPISGRRRFWWSVAAMGLFLAACGGGDDDDGTVGDTSPDTGTAEAGETASDEPVASDTGGEESAGATDDGGGAAEVAPPEGTGTLVVDLCNGGQFIDGAITIDDLVSWGALGTTDVEINGGGTFDANAYNDFGALCDIEDANGDVLTINMSNNVGAYDGAAERSPVAVGEEGTWKWALSDGLETLVMEHTDADGTRDTFGVLWFPDDVDRKNPEEVQRVFDPLIEAIVTRTTVEIERIAPPPTPDWFACDDANGGVVGLDPATLLATVGYREDRGVSVSPDTGGFFGFTECTVQTEVGLDSLTIQVQDPGAELQDTVESFLAGWPEAVAETIAGYEVALLDARAFTVIDETPTEIRILVTDSDVDADFRAAIELVLSSIG